MCGCRAVRGAWATCHRLYPWTRLTFFALAESTSLVFQGGVGTCEAPPFHAEGFGRLIFCRSCAGNHNQWEFVRAISCQVQKNRLYSYPLQPLSLRINISTLFPSGCLNLRGEGCDAAVPSGTGTLQSLILHTSIICGSLLSSIPYKKKPL